MEVIESSHRENDESNTEKRSSRFKKISKAGGKQKSSKNQKRDYSKNKPGYFFTSPTNLHYFLMFQLFKNKSVKNLVAIFFYYVSYRYNSADI